MRLGITGFPLTYTKSPGLHRSFLRKARLKGSYDVLPFDPARGKRAFFAFLDGLRREGLVGLNVTVPHKEWAFDYVRARGGQAPGVEGKCAALVGAANTVIFGRRRVLGANTDAGGLWDDIAAWPAAKTIAKGFDLVIVGAGGSARGALAALLAGHRLARKAKKVTIWARDPARAKDLELLAAHRTGSAKAGKGTSRPLLVLWCLPPVSAAAAARIFSDAVACAGGSTKSGSKKILLYDLNYGARANVTRDLVSRAQRRAGRGMLERQAAASFRLWRKFYK